jgi:Uma2 family endonuclease
MVMITSRANPPAPRAYLRAPVPLHFPVEEQVPETKRHLAHKTLLFQILTLAFGDHSAIGCDQFVYWDPTDPRQCLAPDAFVRLGAPDELFQCWKVWERGAPDVAVEILSRSDHRDCDLDDKLKRYRRLGVRELVFFDSERDPVSLRIWEAVDGDLVERAIEGLVAPSHCLPASWVVVTEPKLGAHLRLSHDQEGKDLLPTPVEHERLAAEARIRELEAELRRQSP